MSIRSVAFLAIVALTAIGGWLVLGEVARSPRVRIADGEAAVDRAIPRALVDDEVTAEGETPVPGPEPDGASARDWPRRYHESTDDFLLATELVPAAMTGDGAAQHQLGRLLLHCEVYKRILAAYTEGNLAERIESHLSSGNLPEQSRRQFRRGALRCGRLFTDDPFAGYDVPDDAKDFRYWTERAIESGDPVAVVGKLFNTAVERKGTDDETDAFRAKALTDVRGIVFSGNGAALYTLGGMLSHPSVGADPEDGYAWIVAACEGGYDCSNSNPDIGFGCVERGTCEPASTFLDVLQRDLGAGKYARIYAKAQDIEYKIEANDWDGLQEYLEIK